MGLKSVYRIIACPKSEDNLNFKVWKFLIKDATVIFSDIITFLHLLLIL